MLGTYLHEISGDVRISRQKRGLNPASLAKKAEVGVRFLVNLEKETELRWKRELLYKLLRVLKVLELSRHVETVEEFIKSSTTKRKRKRIKIDNRPGGVVVRRRRCCRKKRLF